jgi:hypothetical protein
LDIKVQSIPTLTDQSLYIKVADFLRGIAEQGIAIVDSVRTNNIESENINTKTLCLDGLCITKDQLQQILNSQSVPSSTPTPEPSPEPSSDTTPPVITLVGDVTITLSINDTYTEQGAEALDNIDGSITPIITGTVDTATVGTYTITYTATDLSNNVSTTTRTVNVTEPVL